MGTKRHLAQRVRLEVERLRTRGKVVDLFSGMGSVASALAPDWPVATNDLLSFTTVVAKARFLDAARQPASRLVKTIQTDYREHLRSLYHRHQARLAWETVALEGTRPALFDYMQNSPHVGNDRTAASEARMAAVRTDPDRYSLAILYFSAGYFGLRQAAQLDALRFTIDRNLKGGDKDWALAAWLASASTAINAPGHAAQYLRPTTETAAERIKRCWRRDIWACFQDRLAELSPVGTENWRRNNSVHNQDALDFLGSPEAEHISLVYADPPYTKDQYSRYYHVYETLYRYDFPASTGAGRYRSDRQSTPYSIKSRVGAAFKALISAVADLGVPLILSYPSDGLLSRAGTSLLDVLRGRFSDISVLSVPADHSTMGASKGTATKRATENLYVCRPESPDRPGLHGPQGYPCHRH
jgi:adenine-specific DNA-methyltransferase